MKRKAVVMLMTAVMAIAIAACGDESAGDSTPVDAAVKQSGEETLSVEDAEASGETESGNPAYS